MNHYNKGLFSVVIPAYNREKTVGRSIESILNQTYKNFEIIIVDDGSKDKTRDICKTFLYDKRVSYLYQENSGAQCARNNGLYHSRGEFVIFLDSDDELLPFCLEKMIKEYEKDTVLGAVYCIAGIKKNGILKPMRNDHLYGNVYKEVLRQGYLTSSSFISMRKSIFVTIGGWDVNFPASQDDDMCFRIAKYYKIGFINEILGIYYFDAGKGKQISSSPSRVANGWWLLWKKYEQDVVMNCGISTVRKHYIKCAYRFRKCNENVKYRECLDKIRQYSGFTTYQLALIKIKLMICLDYINFFMKN